MIPGTGDGEQQPDHIHRRLSSAEDIARLATLVVPAADGIWLAELGGSICGLLGLWREVILRRPFAAPLWTPAADDDEAAGSGDGSVGELRSRRDRLLHERDRLVAALRRPPRWPVTPLLCACSALRKTELLIEMAAARFCPARKWHAILGVEAVKALVRLVALAQLRGTTMIYERLELHPPPTVELADIPEEQLRRRVIGGGDPRDALASGLLDTARAIQNGERGRRHADPAAAIGRLTCVSGPYKHLHNRHFPTPSAVIRIRVEQS